MIALDIQMAIIRALAERYGLSVVEDPASQDFREIRARLRREILEAFAIPAHLCGGKGDGMGEKIVLPGKIYLGDSVYCEVEQSGGYVLTTENGLRTDPSNTIYLEPGAYAALVRYDQAVNAAIAEWRETKKKEEGKG